MVEREGWLITTKNVEAATGQLEACGVGNLRQQTAKKSI